MFSPKKEPNALLIATIKGSSEQFYMNSAFFQPVYYSLIGVCQSLEKDCHHRLQGPQGTRQCSHTQCQNCENLLVGPVNGEDLSGSFTSLDFERLQLEKDVEAKESNASGHQESTTWGW